MKKANIQILIVLLLCAVSLNAQTYFDTIVLKKHLTYLASDELGGRYPETEGSIKAGNYILQHYLDLNLKPLCDNGFQYFKFPESWTVGDSNYAELDGRVLKVERDYAPLNYLQTRKTSLNANVVFSYQSIDSINPDVLANKWFMIFDDTTKNFRKKAFLKAINKGVAGILLVTNDIKPEINNVLSLPASKSTQTPPIVCITRALADTIFKHSLPTFSDTDKGLSYIESSIKFSATTHFVQNFTNARNVVFLLEGSDPKLKYEYIVVGGHYDHLGTKTKRNKVTGEEETLIYNGADDNASGSVGVMALAEKYARSEKAPKRSIIFVNFDAEEEGLLGSLHFFDSTMHIKPSQVKAMVNIDMIGRYTEDKGLTITGIESMEEVKEVKKIIEKKSSLNVLFPKHSILFAGSDHVNFYKYKIPVIFYGTNVHPDYHKSTDTVEKINFADMQKVLLSIDRLIDNLANRKKNLTFKEFEF